MEIGMTVCDQIKNRLFCGATFSCLQNPTLRPLAERSRQGLTPVQPPY